jgi:hypothetical protein
MQWLTIDHNFLYLLPNALLLKDDLTIRDIRSRGEIPMEYRRRVAREKQSHL